MRFAGSAKTTTTTTYKPDDDFIVLEDPDGNLFCVVDTSKS